MSLLKKWAIINWTEIDTEVLFQWKDSVPIYEEYITCIDGIYMDKATCELADPVYELKGNAIFPVKNDSQEGEGRRSEEVHRAKGGNFHASVRFYIAIF